MFGMFGVFGMAGLLGCDEAKQLDDTEPSASLQANTTIQATELELAAVVTLVEREDVRDAESLEALINAEDSTIQVDIDKDGTRDFIAVHEVAASDEARPMINKIGTITADVAVEAEAEAEAEADGAVTVTGEDGQTVRFELRAIPSATVTIDTTTTETVELAAETQTVLVATVDVELHAEQREVVVEASYAPSLVVIADVEVEHTYVHRVTLEHRHDHLVVVGAPFLAWVWVDVRPVYIGHVHLPPGHAKRLGLSWHHSKHGGHGGHGGHDGHGGPGGPGGHAGGHGGPTKVQVKTHGDTKIHIKSKGGGGSSKVHVKSGKPGKGGKGKH